MASPSPEVIKIASLLEKAIVKSADDAARQAEEELEPRVYLIQGIDGGPIKIGVAKHPAKRCAELQRTSPIELRVLVTFDGGIRIEHTLHDRFTEWRLHGEWFDEDCPELAALVAALVPFLDPKSNATPAPLTRSADVASTTGG